MEVGSLNLSQWHSSHPKNSILTVYKKLLAEVSHPWIQSRLSVLYRRSLFGKQYSRLNILIKIPSLLLLRSQIICLELVFWKRANELSFARRFASIGNFRGTYLLLPAYVIMKNETRWQLQIKLYFWTNDLA